jgi:hypothetical protein
VEEGWSDLSATVEGNRHGPAIGMIPPIVTAGLSTADEAELPRPRWNTRAVSSGRGKVARGL